MSCSDGTCHVGPPWLRWTLRIFNVVLFGLLGWWILHGKSLLEIIGILGYWTLLWVFTRFFARSIERSRTPRGPNTRPICARCGGDMRGREDGRTCPRCGAMYGVDHVVQKSAPA